MKLDYGTQISPVPITLSVGVLRKPTLQEISELTFDKFTYFEFMVKMMPKIYYTVLQKENGGKEYWETLTKEEQESISLYDLILNDEKLCNIYVEILNFFFVESVIFREGFFILLKNNIENINDEINSNSIRGVISKELLPQILEFIQQICCIYNEEEKIDDAKFKCNLAKRLMERMQKNTPKNSKETDINLTIPNIISAICNRHPSLNYTNIWGLTVFQLFDAFSRMHLNVKYQIDSTRVSVWGDEKKTFDISLWYKNEYDKK